MAKVVVLGGGVSGHTAALFLKRFLGAEHQVTVITPNSKWNWIPSNVWVGVGSMKKRQVVFELAPIYKKQKIEFIQAKAVSIHPKGSVESERPFVTFERTAPGKAGEKGTADYDFLINATGPKLKFNLTPGLGPEEGHTASICTANHALEANAKIEELIKTMRGGQRVKIVIGTGHGTCTCQGAGFEYLMNVDHLLREKGLREMADITYLTNEYNLGDFGVGGIHIKQGGYITHSKIFTESLFTEKNINWISQAHVEKIEEEKIHYKTLDGETNVIDYDFSMLIPPFSGVGLKAYDKEDKDITEELFAPNGFMKVDADYSPKDFDEWKAKDWPRKLQNPSFKNIFAVGIAFAPPHAISKPMQTKDGVKISPTPPRTGMPSAMMGRAVASSIADMIKNKNMRPTHESCMSEMGAACVASVGHGLINGSAVAMTMYPIVQDYEKYPQYGRDTNYSFGEIGLSSHWIKLILHYLFIYKAKARPFWWLIPE